ncbi:hypothetical protein TNIN_234281, partial [Trichonephila inaurata madagascariensis]
YGRSFKKERNSPLAVLWSFCMIDGIQVPAASLTFIEEIHLLVV